MKVSDLDFFRQWFPDYCRSFYSANPEDQENIVLKEHHTRLVCRNIIQIAQALPLSGNDILLAEASALFHDIGRFKQYAEYGTFRDNVSVNHGLLGSEILLEKGVLQSLPEKEQSLIIQAVKFHNAFTIPTLEDPDETMFLKLVRDADKLDVWRVFTEYYAVDGIDRPTAVGLDLPDSPGYSEDALSCLYKKSLVSLADVKNLNDLKIMLLSWVYDINFSESFRILAARNIIKKIAAQLPTTDEIKHAAVSVQEYIDDMRS